MRLLLALTLLLLPLAGCLDGDDGSADDQPTDEPMDEPMDDPEPQPEDRGEYIYHPDTGLCEAKEYTDVGDAGQAYESAIGGGTWAFTETNGVPGLQYENNHPMAGQSGGVFDLPVEDDCTNGDQATV